MIQLYIYIHIYRKVIQLYMYTYIHIIFHILFHYGFTGYWIFMLYSRTLLFIHSIYNGLHLLIPNWASLVAQTVKKSACNAGDPGSILGWEGPLEEGMATHSSILAWRIPWTEEPGGLQSTGSQRVRHDWTIKIYNPQTPYPSFLYSLRMNYF